jgi:hypothetical protein
VTTNPKRFSHGWYEPCFRHTQRTFQDNTTGETHYYDDFKTIDGIKSRCGPK